MESYLLMCARAAARRAYCPYSKFHVGAAVRRDDQLIISGCNVENASYGLTICAERSAVFAAVAALGIKPAADRVRIIEVAVTCPDLPDGFDPKCSMPCGACRQVLAEFCDPDTPVHIDRVGTFTLADLLPRPFTL